MTHYTKAQMLAIWRAALGLDTPYAECSIEQFDGINVNDLIAQRMRQWYLNLLDTADPALLPTADIAARCTHTARPNNAAAITLSDDCRRVVHVRAASWPMAIAPEADTACAALLGHPFAAPTARRPLAIAALRSLLIAPCAPADAIEVVAVVDPGEQLYTLDESLLATIPTTL
ncbi:MAG: hypothetical protein ACI4AM_08540 [Muribaculaceae bacterium]